jgi:hypothetical protein
MAHEPVIEGIQAWHIPASHPQQRYPRSGTIHSNKRASSHVHGLAHANSTHALDPHASSALLGAHALAPHMPARYLYCAPAARNDGVENTRWFRSVRGPWPCRRLTSMGGAGQTDEPRATSDPHRPDRDAPPCPRCTPPPALLCAVGAMSVGLSVRTRRGVGAGTCE